MHAFHALSNGMRFQSGIGKNASSDVRIGLITSYNPSDCTVKISLQPVDESNAAPSQTGWIPLATSFMGLVGAPTINDQVVVVFQEGSLNSGIVIGKIYSDEDIPPPVPAGEWWLTHPSGTFIKVKNNGDVEITANNDLKVNTISGNVDVTAAADVNINAVNANVLAQAINLSNGGTLLKLVTEALETLYNAHTHGGGPPPDMPFQMTNAQLTTIVKAE